jgi:DNA repair exonuclease SbcCD nuclease subunit
MKPFSFIHTADLHLDSPFTGLRQVDGAVASLIKDATFRAFDKVVDLALGHKVDFLLVAGDVYDASDRSLRAQLKFADGLKKLALAGIRSFVCHGNHDPLDGWAATLRWPEGVHIFGPELESVPLSLGGEDIAVVHGISYPKSQIDEDFGKGFQRQGPYPFQIGLFHCSMGSDPAHETYAPRTMDELVSADLDYWALGHVHTYRVLKDGHPFIAYPGNTQGLHIREPGPRGCLLVRVDGQGTVNASFEPTDAVRWFSKNIQISDLETEADLIEALERTCDEIHHEAEGRPAIGRITIVGRGALHPVLRKQQVVGDLTERLRETGLELAPPLWIERIKVQTSTPIDLDSRRKSADFLGEVLRLIENSRQNPTGLQEMIGELYNDRRGRRFLDIPAEDELIEMLGEVESMCLDELVPEEAE